MMRFVFSALQRKSVTRHSCEIAIVPVCLKNSNISASICSMICCFSCGNLSAVFIQTVSGRNGASRSLIFHLAFVEAKIYPDSIVYTDSYKSCDVLDASSFHHERINHMQEFADGKSHINGIENFWSQAKRQLRKFNGIPEAHLSYI